MFGGKARLARYLGLERERCDCDACLRALFEWCARKMTANEAKVTT